MTSKCKDVRLYEYRDMKHIQHIYDNTEIIPNTEQFRYNILQGTWQNSPLYRELLHAQNTATGHISVNTLII